MKILFVEPPFHSFMHYDQWYYSGSLSQLAAIAHAKGHEVAIYDGDKYFYKDIETRKRQVFVKKQKLYYENVDNFDHYIWKHFKKTLKEFNPEVVGVSVFTCKLKSALNVLKLVYEFNKDIKTCVGGAHVTGAPEMFISNINVDGVFVGYSDVTFPEWLSSGCKKGVIVGDTNKIDMDEIPYVRREALLFPEQYTSKDLSMMVVGRGCVGRCIFCSNSFMWSGKPYLRSSESIKKEVAELIDKWKVKKLSIKGDSLSDYPEEAKRIANVLKSFGLSWEINVRWATVTKELIEHFIDCGCNKISVGLESGEDRVLKYMKKGCRTKNIEEKAKIMNDLGINWHLFCIIGFPIETIEDMKKTKEFAIKIKPTSISLNSLSPLPGTKIYESIDGLTPEIASSMNQLHPNYSFSEHVDLKTFEKIHMEILEEFDRYNKNKEVK